MISNSAQKLNDENVWHENNKTKMKTTLCASRNFGVLLNKTQLFYKLICIDPEAKSMVPKQTTKYNEHCWWFVLLRAHKLTFFLLHIHTLNKIWWLCLVPISTTRFASEVGYKNAPNLIVLYKENTFLWTMPSNSLTENEKHDIPSHILTTISGWHASLIF